MALPLTNDSFLQWDPAQVSSYVNAVVSDDQRSVGSLFLDNNIDGSLLPFLTTEHLKELGIISLHTRLLIKKAINELITNHYQKNPPRTLNDPEYRLNSININNNYISHESLALSSVLVKDMFTKMSVMARQQTLSSQSEVSSPISPSHQMDLKRLNDNFIKLKTDLIPVIRHLKDSKPLPTPTNESPTHPFGGSDHDDGTLNYFSGTTNNKDNLNNGTIPSNNTALSTTNGNSSNISTLRNGVARSNSNGTTSARIPSGAPSPTYSNRFSTASIISTGTAKVVQQTVPKLTSQAQNDFVLQRNPNPMANRSVSDSNMDTQQRPRLVETKSSGAAPTIASMINSSNGNSNGTNPSSTLSGATLLKPTLKSYGSGSSQGSHGKSNLSQSASNEPLKQLRASTDDSCLKILQQAMKRHHIPRDDWSKYVLVICYGDKERILKLGERPVVIFKELQEMGKHPAIMLRQLATTMAEEPSGVEYEDSRIGSDIPGGTL
ncbi:uncharacterized protein RJT20DRAFT_54900 [Scheffersomyces xylosifermentans]|uniref:uncharacterized protein n=1 Tax=Scheffersomyces xylosifermentans TaxID=1304137 RepID=UPI00315CC2AD